MKRVAHAHEPIVPIPPVVVAVDVHLALTVIAVEDRVAFYAKYLPYHHPSIILWVEYYLAF